MNIAKKYYVILATCTSAVFCSQYNSAAELGALIRGCAARTDIAQVAENGNRHDEIRRKLQKARAEGGIPCIQHSQEIPPLGVAQVIEIISPYEDEKQQYNQYVLLGRKGLIIVKQAKEPSKKERKKIKISLPNYSNE